ncbi:hypothetical protein TspCOW1_25790 [Thiohalobacter sp. COW1]|uniref:ATP-dependent DNA helicase RecG n=1 Tax=Thiohalobacter thiocyanaticus TaxID=585455 RepID=A0A1Z4VLR8_9GAMM|nr:MULTISPECIES: hypothetical protein [Thiohalobacter]BAZ92541.1 ATP-dependent DNA helicase RecG [Thiohalobacter thiocyanaticus]BCO32476.1 hypothetical protein TspCOW1_25790 [Thiohalobacter sp. COW1]
MNPSHNASIIDLDPEGQAPATEVDTQQNRDEFLDGRQEGLYEACLIVDKVAAQHGHEDVVAEALDAMRILIRESIHTTDAEAIRARVNALANAAATRS